MDTRLLASGEEGRQTKMGWQLCTRQQVREVQKVVYRLQGPGWGSSCTHAHQHAAGGEGWSLVFRIYQYCCT